MMKFLSVLMVVLAVLARRSESFGIIGGGGGSAAADTKRMENPAPKKVAPVLTSTTTSTMSRSNFLFSAVAAVAWTSSTCPAWADDASLKGTKKDPDFEGCLSLCLYDCTKAKGTEQKSRKECLPECKSTCAKTKAQTMLGTPVSK